MFSGAVGVIICETGVDLTKVTKAQVQDLVKQMAVEVGMCTVGDMTRKEAT